MSNEWIGVDLDATLAYYDEWRGPEHIGKPIPLMVERVKRWLKEGKEVRIFTARVAYGDPGGCRKVIESWCEKHIGQPLEVTNEKDYSMIELWDDRCVQVQKNTGVNTSLALKPIIIEKCTGLSCSSK